MTFKSNQNQSKVSRKDPSAEGSERPNQGEGRPFPPAGPSADPLSALNRLISLIEILLDPLLGCPWDKSQTTKTVTEDFLEEVYELRQALNLDQGDEILEEAGDLVFLLVFLSFLTRGSHGFGLTQIMDAATDKMLLRHPHIFGEAEKVVDLEGFWKQWYKIKRASKPQSGVLSTVPVALPALTRCYRLAQKAGRAGFDFTSAQEVRSVISKELKELDIELERVWSSGGGKIEDPQTKARVSHEIGDLLASIVNLARLLGFSAEKSLDGYNRRFIGRFEFIEDSLAKRGLKPEDVTAEELETLWAEAKKTEKISG
jgi:MazG family protein